MSVEILPIPIVLFDQSDFPSSRPGLDRLFALDRIDHPVEFFIPDESLHPIATRKTSRDPFPMLPDPPRQVARHSRVERAPFLGRKDVGVSAHNRMATWNG